MINFLQLMCLHICWHLSQVSMLLVLVLVGFTLIVQCRWDSSVLDVPRKKRNFYKFWWDEELNLMKDQAIHSFDIWKSVGKPRSGKEFDAMCFVKLKYKAMIKSQKAASNNQFSDSLNDALLSKNMTAFWNTWRSKFEKKQSVKCCGWSSWWKKHCRPFCWGL